jgi:hypothetical protein
MYSQETFAHLNAIEDKKYRIKRISGLLRRQPMKWIKTADDVRHAPDFTGLSTSEIEAASGKTMIDEYFVDSSGFGTQGEPASLYSDFKNTVKDQLEICKKAGKRLYAILSGAGQFQVYITLYTNR